MSVSGGANTNVQGAGAGCPGYYGAPYGYAPPPPPMPPQAGAQPGGQTGGQGTAQ